MYISRKQMNFNSALACHLDNETDKEKFEALFNFMKLHYPSDLSEWCVNRNFKGDIKHIIETLIDIEVLY